MWIPLLLDLQYLKLWSQPRKAAKNGSKNLETTWVGPGREVKTSSLQLTVRAWKMVVGTLKLGGETSNIFYVHPETWGKWSHLTSINFQMGWGTNHQPEYMFFLVTVAKSEAFRLCCGHRTKKHLKGFTCQNLIKNMQKHMVFPKIVGFPPKSSTFLGFSIINHPFWGTLFLVQHPYPPLKICKSKSHHFGNNPIPWLWNQPSSLAIRSEIWVFFFFGCFFWLNIFWAPQIFRNTPKIWRLKFFGGPTFPSNVNFWGSNSTKKNRSELAFWFPPWPVRQWLHPFTAPSCCGKFDIGPYDGWGKKLPAGVGRVGETASKRKK